MKRFDDVTRKIREIYFKHSLEIFQIQSNCSADREWIYKFLHHIQLIYKIILSKYAEFSSNWYFLIKFCLIFCVIFVVLISAIHNYAFLLFCKWISEFSIWFHGKFCLKRVDVLKILTKIREIFCWGSNFVRAV